MTIQESLCAAMFCITSSYVNVRPANPLDEEIHHNLLKYPCLSGNWIDLEQHNLLWLPHLNRNVSFGISESDAKYTKGFKIILYIHSHKYIQICIYELVYEICQQGSLHQAIVQMVF